MFVEMPVLYQEAHISMAQVDRRKMFMPNKFKSIPLFTPRISDERPTS